MNQKIVCTVGAFVFATASALAAQSAQTPSTLATGRAGAAAAPVTVAGCVERTGNGPAATFKLTKIAQPGAAASSSMSNAPRTAAPEAPGSVERAPGGMSQQPAAPRPAEAGASIDLPKEVFLKSISTIDLNQHASHQVEVTGTYEEAYGAGGATTAAPSVGGATAPSTRSAAPGRDDNVKTLNVSSLKMVAASCN